MGVRAGRGVGLRVGGSPAPCAAWGEVAAGGSRRLHRVRRPGQRTGGGRGILTGDDSWLARVGTQRSAGGAGVESVTDALERGDAAIARRSRNRGGMQVERLADHVQTAELVFESVHGRMGEVEVERNGEAATSSFHGGERAVAMAGGGRDRGLLIGAGPYPARPQPASRKRVGGLQPVASRRFARPFRQSLSTNRARQTCCADAPRAPLYALGRGRATLRSLRADRGLEKGGGSACCGRGKMAVGKWRVR